MRYYCSKTITRVLNTLILLLSQIININSTDVILWSNFLLLSLFAAAGDYHLLVLDGQPHFQVHLIHLVHILTSALLLSSFINLLCLP